MRTVKILILILILAASFIAIPACKKGSPTSPDVDTKLEYSGRITLNGQPFANVTIYLSWFASGSTSTDSDGRFSFKNIPSGSYIITPSQPDYSFNPSNYEVHGSSQTNLNFTADFAVYGTDVDHIAMGFSAQDQNDFIVDLSDYHGHVILMDFTADWCIPCREKAETAEQFYQQYKDRGFMYILIVIDGNNKVWAQTYGLTFPVLDDNLRSIYNFYGRTSIPLPHVLDRNQVIRYKTTGWSKSEVEELIKKYL